MKTSTRFHKCLTPVYVSVSKYSGQNHETRQLKTELAKVKWREKLSLVSRKSRKQTGGMQVATLSLTVNIATDGHVHVPAT
jgi:hypothetical protein